MLNLVLRSKVENFDDFISETKITWGFDDLESRLQVGDEREKRARVKDKDGVEISLVLGSNLSSSRTSRDA